MRDEKDKEREDGVVINKQIPLYEIIFPQQIKQLSGGQEVFTVSW